MASVNLFSESILLTPKLEPLFIGFTIQYLDSLAASEGLEPEAVSRFVHGTTVGINTILQRKGASLALITNAGFEDVIEMARLRMPEMYSLFCHRPEPLIPRDRVFGIPARMRADGTELRAPDRHAVVAAVEADNRHCHG